MQSVKQSGLVLLVVLLLSGILALLVMEQAHEINLEKKVLQSSSRDLHILNNKRDDHANYVFFNPVNEPADNLLWS